LFNNFHPDVARFIAGPALRAISDQPDLTLAQKNARADDAWTVMTTVDPCEVYSLMLYSHAYVLNALCGDAGHDALVESKHGMLSGTESPMKRHAMSSYAALHRSFCQNANTFLRVAKPGAAPSATLASTRQAARQAKTTMPPAEQAERADAEPIPDRTPPSTATPATGESKTPPIADGPGGGTAPHPETRPVPPVAATDLSATRTGNTTPAPRNVARSNRSNPETVKNHEFQPAPARPADNATPVLADVGRSTVTPAVYRDSLMATSAAYVAGTNPGTGAANLARKQSIDAAGIPRDIGAVAAQYVAQPRHRLGDPTT
jgi:hypothetical protein